MHVPLQDGLNGRPSNFALVGLRSGQQSGSENASPSVPSPFLELSICPLASFISRKIHWAWQTNLLLYSISPIEKLSPATARGRP